MVDCSSCHQSAARLTIYLLTFTFRVITSRSVAPFINTDSSLAAASDQPNNILALLEDVGTTCVHWRLVPLATAEYRRQQLQQQRHLRLASSDDDVMPPPAPTRACASSSSSGIGALHIEPGENVSRKRN
jgi:hypothetical protein